MAVADVLAALQPFDDAFAVLAGVLIAAFLVRTVVGWFVYVMRGPDGF